MRTLRRWIAIGVAEAVLSLILIAIAPIFLNSTQPIVGFLIWAVVLAVLGGSSVYVVVRLRDAATARRLFLAKFPDYHRLSVHEFLDIPASHVAEQLDMLEAAATDPDFQALHIAPLDLLRQSHSSARSRSSQRKRR